MNVDRKRRYILGTFLPGIIAAILAAFYVYFTSSEDSEFLGFLVFFVAFGVPASILPAAVYSYVMEKHINPKVLLHFDVVFLSTLMGTIAGAFFLVLLPAGTVAGFIVGIILRDDYMKTTYPSLNSADKPVTFALLTQLFIGMALCICYLCWFAFGVYSAVGDVPLLMSLLGFVAVLGCCPFLLLVLTALLLNSELRIAHTRFFYLIITLPLSVFVFLLLGVAVIKLMH